MFKENPKYQQLLKTLAENKKKSEQLMTRMDMTLNNSKKAKQNLDMLGSRMNTWQQGYKKVIQEMALKMFMPIQNPLKLNSERGPCELPSIQTMDFVVERLLKQQQVLILTGAGVSCASGIPTFRGDDGLYQRKFIVDQKQYEPQQFISYSFFNKCPEVLWQWCRRFHSIVKKSQPNQNHRLIHSIAKFIQEKFNKKVTIVTTNIDGFHKNCQNFQNIKSEDKHSVYQLYQIHGNACYQICQDCAYKQEIASNFSEKISFQLQNMNKFQMKNIQPLIFKCSNCSSKRIRPNILFFDEKYHGDFGGLIAKQSYPMVICIGSSLETGLCAKIVLQAKETVEVNKKGVIQYGKVYKFQQDCQSFLKQLLQKLNQKN